MQTVLLIEDERDLAELVAHNLEREGYQSVIAANGPQGLEMARERNPDLVLLDLMLPGLPGSEVCKALKQQESTAQIPVIMVSARGEETDRVAGFELGAEDYVVKPFSTRELVLRVKAVLRRFVPEEEPTSLASGTPRALTVGTVTIDTDRHLVSVDGRPVAFTLTEFKLLQLLAGRPGRVQSRDVLMRDVWGYDHIEDTRTVDTHMTRLRNKLGEAGEMIKTVRGFGYKLESA